MHNLLSRRFTFWLAWRNAKHWRWRTLCSAMLIALAFILLVLYAAATESFSRRMVAQTEQLPESLIDVVVLLEPGYRPIATDAWAESLYARPAFVDYRDVCRAYEETIGLALSSDRGSFEALGLQPQSPFWPDEAEIVRGRTPERTGELMLPSAIAARLRLALSDSISCIFRSNDPLQVQPSHITLRLVGIYSDDSPLAQGIVLHEDAMALVGSDASNRILAAAADPSSTELFDLLRQLYPQQTIYSAHLPQELGRSLTRQYYRSSSPVLFLIFLFAVIGVLTVVVLTFFERRQEMAALKAMGIGIRQLFGVLVWEQVFTELAAMVLGAALLALALWLLPMLQTLDALYLRLLVARSALCAAAAPAFALVFPLLTVRAASVDQLLHARRIPLRMRSLDHMEPATAVLIHREQEENVRILHTPPLADPSLYYLLQAGSEVKRGELIASYDSFFGYDLLEWRAPCDGRILEINEGGVIVIRPQDPQEPFYPYSGEAVRQFRHSFTVFEQARQSQRQEGAIQGERFGPLLSSLQDDQTAQAAMRYSTYRVERQPWLEGSFALIVPEECLRREFRGSEEAYLLDLLIEGELQPRQVEIGRKDGGRVEIISGLKQGDLVALRSEEGGALR